MANKTTDEPLVMKLDLKNKGKKQVKRFNTEEALLDMVDETKRSIILHPAKKKILIGAKDSGKTHLVKVDEIWKMEIDNMASGVALRKYSTAAAKRLGASFAKTLIRIQQKGYKFPTPYKKSQNYFYRLKSKSNMMENQLQEYASFDDENGLAGIDVQNGGYFATVHIEEPALKDDVNEAPTEKEWKGSLGVVMDSVNRTVRDYRNTNPFHAPFKTTWWVTMNDWDEGHPESIYAQKYAPREEFLKRQFAGLDPEVLLGNKELILKYWDRIAVALIQNHTWQVYVEPDDTLIVRMTKLANPQLREDPDEQRQTLANIQEALIDNDNFELARQLGMLYEGSSDEPFAYNIYDMNEVKVNSEDVIKGRAAQLAIEGTETVRAQDAMPAIPAKTIIGRSIAWDIDVNRRLTGTITLVTANIWSDPNPQIQQDYMDSVRLTTLPQIEIPAYGRGKRGEHTPGYYYSIAKATSELITKYPIARQQFGSHLTLDDDRGPWMNGVVEYLEQMLSEKEKEQLNLHFQIKTGKQGDIRARQDDVQTLWDEGVAEVDRTNRQLFNFVESVRKDAKGKRIEKGKYEKLADFMNSYEGTLFPFISSGATDALLAERIKEEEFYGL